MSGKRIDIDREHGLRIINVLYHECHSAGGDGDALWYTAFYTLESLRALVVEYNSKLRFPWRIEDMGPETFSWGDNQEWVIITIDKNVYDTAPESSQFLLNN